MVTSLGLGLAALGRPAYINLGRDADLGPDRGVTTMELRCHRMLDAAHAAGVRYVDAARSYGRAEEFLASWLDDRGIAPGAVTIGSKWGYRYTGDWQMDAPVQETKDHSLAMFRRQHAETAALLGPYLRLYQVHSATLDSGVLDDRAVLDALAELHERGMVVGLTVSGPHQADVVRRALDVDVDGTNPFSTVQATWNLFEPSVGPALAVAHDRGWGVIVKEALANGRLAPRAPDPATAPAADVGGRWGGGVDEVALVAALDQPWADVVLSGAVDPPQLDANLASIGHTLSDEERARMASMAEPPERYWQTRSALPWR